MTASSKSSATLLFAVLCAGPAAAVPFEVVPDSRLHPLPAADSGLVHKIAAAVGSSPVKSTLESPDGNAKPDTRSDADELTVSDMLPSIMSSDELVDDDSGANEAAEVAALTPTQDEADDIARAYVEDGLVAEGAADILALVEDDHAALATAATSRSSSSAAWDPETDMSRLHDALPIPVGSGPQGTDPVTALQRALQAKGVAVNVDGKWDSGTRAALKTYQSRLGLEASGQLDDKTAASLGVAF